MPNMWRVLTVAGFILGLAAGTTPVRAQTAAPQVQPDDRTLGKSDAPVTIFEYASLDCPHCADFEEHTLPTIEKDWIDTGKARLVFRDFPLHEGAVRAAILARCAPPQQFFSFVSVLFQSQSNWALAQNTDAELAKLARLSGMSDDKFKQCMSDKTIETQVYASRLEGEKYGINSTPTFFINGTKVEGALGPEAFERALTQAAPK